MTPDRFPAAIDLVALRPLMARSSGSPDVAIALIDGPVAPHAAFARQPVVLGEPAGASAGFATLHGTFVAGMLGARRDGATPGLCPACTLHSHPVFADRSAAAGVGAPAVARAIHDGVRAGARIINLSLAIDHPSTADERSLQQALDVAARRGVLVVAAAGNQGAIGGSVITRHPWVIPVTACDRRGRPSTRSNLGGAIGRRGLGAPGEHVASLAPGGVAVLDGTSVAAPFVTGAIALLWSLFPRTTPQALKLAILRAEHRSSVSPPLLDGAASLELLH